jgi:uncharacterized protein (TIGR02246 family)
VDIEAQASEVYKRLIGAWNSRDAEAMAEAIAAQGLVIGYDGSQMLGRDQVREQLGAIFADHETASYVTKVRSIGALGRDAALLHAVAGMVPPGQSAILRDRNAIQTVVVVADDDGVAATLFQTTPAQFHGRPELTETLTAELNEVWERGRGREPAG